MQIRKITRREIPLLTDFLYEALFQPDPEHLAPRTILQAPDVWIYVDEFGQQPDDHCLVALVDGKLVGAVWVRCIHGYGYVEDGVPEFALSVYPQYRKQGIGTKLMEEMLAELRRAGYARVSLAVQKENYAVKLYRQLGFVPYRESQQEYIMVCAL